MFSGMSSQTSARLSFAWFSLFDTNFVTLPDLVIGLPLFLLNEESIRVAEFSLPYPVPK